ncbi:MAG: glycosyltransferase family 2 protein [Ginsengibacter sp.]
MPVSPSSQPFFSVIITTYNRKMLLRRALQSLIQQTETDWEAIIIDDGSTDNTEFEIKPFLNDNRLQFIYQNNTGYSLAKNSGIFLAKGKYVTFLDSDDEYLLSHLETRKEILTQHPEIDFLYGGLSVIGNEYVPDRFDNRKLVHLNDCVIGGTFFIKKELAFSLNGFRDIAMGSDAEFFERVGATGSVIQKTSMPTYIYHRENPDSLTNLMMEKIINP